MDIIGDSDDEYDFKKLRKDLKSEIDVARYYRKLQENIRSKSSLRKSKKQKKSQSTQTDLVSSSFSLLWLMSYQNLINNLHSGLSNVIRQCEVDDASSDGLHHRNKEMSNVYDRHDSKDPKIGNSLKQRIQCKDLKQDLSNLLEMASTLQDAFVNRIGEEHKALSTNKNKLCSGEKQSNTEDETIDLLSGDTFWEMKDRDTHSSSTENSEDYEPIQNFIKPKFNIKKHKHIPINEESKYFNKGYSDNKNIILEEVDPPRISRGISVLSYNPSPHPKAYFNVLKESSPKTMISQDIKLNAANKNRMGLITIGGTISNPSNVLAETADSATKVSACKHTLQIGSKKHQDKYNSLSKEKVKRKDVKQTKF